MYLHYNIGIATEQSFRYIELTDAKIWIYKNVPLCRVWQIGSQLRLTLGLESYVL